MIIRFFCILILPLLVSSCEAEHTPPYLHYWADFDVAKVDETEAVIKNIAKKWNLRVYEKNREQMKLHTRGKDAFYIVLYFGEDSVLSIGNSGFGESLSLMVVDHGNMSISDLEKLTSEVRKTLEGQLNIEFEKSKELTVPVDVEKQ